ncbi:MAG: hypothetical protein R2780_12605 [Crocinitomicaceae bacterium]|nr:hypothetical protein [Crocinitomicaceae bacterium]
MRKYLFLGLALIFNVFVSCCGKGKEKEDDSHQVVNVHSDDSTLVDTTTFVDDSGYVNDSLEMENIIEATYGEQWDFCDCVVKNDSVNRVLEEAGDDADYDAILARMDEIDMHCKAMLTTPNTTPEERDAHERKVRKCLKNAQ